MHAAMVASLPMPIIDRWSAVAVGEQMNVHMDLRRNGGVRRTDPAR